MKSICASIQLPFRLIQTTKGFNIDPVSRCVSRVGWDHICKEQMKNFGFYKEKDKKVRKRRGKEKRNYNKEEQTRIEIAELG